MASLLHAVLFSALLSCSLAANLLQKTEKSGSHDGVGLDPEVHMDAIQLIRSKNFTAETHYVTTRDGYILAMHRIPHGKNMPANVSRPVVFLQHGFLCSSTNWLTNLENESFAYILAQAGFDVWMGNVRGNTYSRNHTHLKTNEKAFWNFTYDEHSLKDLPAMIDYTLQVTGQEKLFYVGHSQGTVMGFAGFSANLSLGTKIKAFFALAPVTTVQYISGGFYYISKYFKEIEFVLDIFGHGEFFPNTKLMDWLGEVVCPWDIEVEVLCENALFLVCGFDPHNMNLTRLPVYYGHTPAGTSVKNVEHYSQEVKSGRFEMYDYGSAEANAFHYHGMTQPPAYNLSDLRVPTALYTGGQDWLADTRDVDGLIPKIKDVLFHHKNISYYDHLDFIWGLDAATVVYEDIIAYMKKMI